MSAMAHPRPHHQIDTPEHCGHPLPVDLANTPAISDALRLRILEALAAEIEG